jgi:hypothetical protein
MSDRTAQEIFGVLFEACAKEKDEEAGKRIARKVRRAMEDYDTSRFDLDPEPLVKLGLARHVVVVEDESEGYDFMSFDLKQWDEGY